MTQNVVCLLLFANLFALPGAASAQDNVAPAPNTNREPEKQEASFDLAGTTWKGTEDLQGFGNLTFQFLAGQSVLMVDTKQKIKGNWTRQRNRIEIKFSDAVYMGRIDGRTISGTAEFIKGNNKGLDWKFQVKLQTGEPTVKQPEVKPEVKPSPVAENFSVTQVDFPLGAAADQVQVSWRVHYRNERRTGLRIVGAWLKRPGSADWLKVLGDVHVTQFYVPYEDGSPRFFDMDPRFYPRHGPWKLAQVIPGKNQLLGPSGKMLDDYTVREDRDAGLLWLFTDRDFTMDKQDPGGERTGTTFAQRRQEMVLWSVFQASNYFYIMQYTFQNDGTILCRLGSTGKNLPGHAPRDSGHMHNGLWRVQFDLGGGDPANLGQQAENQLLLMKHEETEQGQGKAATRPYLIQKESQWRWVPEEFTSVRVQNPALKTRGSTVAYELVPLRYGNARHFAPARTSGKFTLPSDAFTQADFWITSDDTQRADYRELPRYTALGNPLSGQPVIWHISSNLHLPRQEDFMDRKKGRVEGCATLLFSGFEIRPRSVFAETPFLNEGMLLPLVGGREP